MKRNLMNVLLVTAFLLFSFGSASAFPLFPSTTVYGGTQFEDDNLDFFVDTNNDGLINVGDVLMSAIEFGTVLDINPGATTSYANNIASDELVAFSVIQLNSIADDGTWYFGQYGDTPMVSFYTGGSINFSVSSNPTLAGARAAVEDGTFLWSFSITDDADTFWAFTPADSSTAMNPSVVAGLAPTTKVGYLNYQLNQVGGNDIFKPLLGDFVIDDGLVDLAGSGDILGGRFLTNGAFARSDIDVSVSPVPEPATFSLLGLGLLGVAYVSRRRSLK